MADQEYKVKLSVEGAEQAAASTKKVDGALEGMGKKAVAAGAALFAAGGVIAAYQQLNSLADVAVKTEKVGAAFENLTTKARFTGDTLGKLQSASRGMVSNFELMRQANNAMLLGVGTSSDQMAEMAMISRRLGAAMGIDAAQAMESLTIGLGRQSKLYLDNLGIIIDVEVAYKKYAKAIGVSADQLTDAQKKIAFTNETMITARELVAGLGDDTETQGDKVAQFRTEWENTKTELGQNLLPVLILVNDSLMVMGDTIGLILKAGESDAWANYVQTMNGYQDALLGITPEQRKLAEATKDANSVASDFVSTTIDLQQVEEARANAQHFQTLKARGFAEEEKKRQEELAKKNEEVAKKEKERHDKRQERLANELQAKLNVYALDVAQARLAEDMANFGKRDPAKDDQSWISGLEGPLEKARRQVEANDLEAKSETDLDNIRFNMAQNRRAYVAAGIGDIARMNQAMKGSAQVTKRLLQAEAMVNAYSAASNTLRVTSELFPPPIPQILAGLTLGAGLAQAASIQQQNFREGGVIEGSGGPRQDNQRVNVSRGESILNAEATARLGRDGIDRLNGGGGAGVTVIINGGMIGTESFVRDVFIPQLEASLKRRLA